MLARSSNKAESRIEAYLNRICTVWRRAAWEGGSNEGLWEMEEPALIELTKPPFFFAFAVAPFYSPYFFLFSFIIFFIILPGGPIARSTILYYPEAKADQHQGWCLSGCTCLVGCFSSVCKFIFILSLMLHDACLKKRCLLKCHVPDILWEKWIKWHST